MVFTFSGEVWYWRGPAPFHFVTVPKEESKQIKSVESLVTYGWGMIPVNAIVGKTEWYTALWAKDGQYILPLKSAIRTAANIELGQVIEVQIEVVFNATPQGY